MHKEDGGDVETVKNFKVWNSTESNNLNRNKQYIFADVLSDPKNQEYHISRVIDFVKY